MKKLIGNYMHNNQLEIQDIIDDYYNYVYTIIKNTNNLISKEDEEEIISDVFFIVWKNQKILDINVNLSPYIASVTKKVVYKKYHELKFINNMAEQDENIIYDKDLEEIIEENEINKFIIEQLKKIGNEEYMIFTKFYYEDKKVRIIAKELNLSVSNVKTKLYRTRKKLKNILSKGGLL